MARTHIPPATVAYRLPVRRLQHVQELDGIRGLAAIMVFFHHALYANLDNKDWPGVFGVISHVAAYGNTGVDLFFVLSGYLITSLLIQDRGSAHYYSDFYWKRALRILPLYLLSLIVMTILERRLSSFVLVAFFIANFDSVFHVVTYGPLWTLSIEEQFYLIWPTIVRRSRMKHIFYWGLFLGVSAIVLRFVFASYQHFNYRLTFLHCDGLAFGALLGYRQRTAERTSRNRRTERTVLLSMLVTAMVLFLLNAHISSGRLHAAPLAAAIRQTGTTLLMGSAVGLVLHCPGSPALKVLRSRPLIFLGMISYAFYLAHAALLEGYDQLFGQPAYLDTWAVARRCAIVLAATLGIAVLSRYAIELPAMSLRKRVLSHPNPTAKSEDPSLPLARL